MDTTKRIQINAPYWLYDYLMETKKFYRINTLSDIVIYHLAVSLKFLFKIMHPELEDSQSFKFEDWLRRLRDEKILSTDDIKSWTGIKADRTIEGYGLRSQEGIHKVAAALMKHTERSKASLPQS